MVATTRNNVVTVLKSKRTAIKRYGVKSLALFGSAARNSLRKSSDVDVLVQFSQPTWANYIGLKFYLEDLLGREVDWVTPKKLETRRPLFRGEGFAECHLVVRSYTLMMFCKPVTMFSTLRVE